MRPFPHLDVFQTELREAIETLRRGPIAPADVVELCRLTTILAQVRDEILYPHCVGRAPGDCLATAMLEFDLVKVLVRELVWSGPDNFMYAPMARALCAAVERSLETEEAEGGLWDAALRGGADSAVMDIEAGDRLQALETLTLQAPWEPLLPDSLETLRPSVPPGATRWSDLN